MTTPRFTRESFPPLVFQPLHFDLLFDVLPDSVRVTTTQTYLCMSEEPLGHIDLNAHDLDIEHVSIVSCPNAKLGPPPSSLQDKLPDFVAYMRQVSEEGVSQEARHEVDKEKRRLRIHLASPISHGCSENELIVRVISTCRPTAHILEGIYFDYTPEGAPPTMITQCQQYGFQRIVPSLDRMPAKTFYTTTIVADSRYTDVISNGDAAPGFGGEGGTRLRLPLRDVFSEEEEARLLRSAPFSRSVARYHNHKVNMAPYLFFLGCGTYDVYQRTVEYPDGDTMLLELVCFPELVRPEHAAASLRSLHDSVLWLHVHTGPEQLARVSERAQVDRLLTRRELLKERVEGPPVRKRSDPAPAAPSPADSDVAELAEVRAALKQLIGVWGETGYKYVGTCYREIAMENSNYGGMENVGNTTIISSRLCPSDYLVDAGYIYMEGVKIHEFYHALNGSQVTGQSPFEIWLNEAVTVHIQRLREDELFSHSFQRLRQLRYAMTPRTGPLAQDRSPISMAIEPKGFNTTQELITAMTYSKAPEFVNMVKLLLGPERFVRALENYHQRYAFGNATTGQWIGAMKELLREDEVDLEAMGRGWLTRTGYPTVTVASPVHCAASGTLSVRVKQSGFEEHPEPERYPWVVPLAWALVRNGVDEVSGVFVMTESEQELCIPAAAPLSADDFVSIGRDWSFFGEVVLEGEQTARASLVTRAMKETDEVNRYLALQALVDEERAAAIRGLLGGDNTFGVSDELMEVHASILSADSIPDGTKAMLLAFSSSAGAHADQYGHLYQEVHDATVALGQAVGRHHPLLLLRHMLEAHEASTRAETQPLGIGSRMLSYACYGLLRNAFLTPPVFGSAATSLAELEAMATDLGRPRFSLVQWLREHLDSSAMSDKTFALHALLELPANVLSEEAKREVQASVKASWSRNPVACEQYIATLTSVDTDEAPQYIRELLKEPFFRMELSGHARSVARGWAANAKRAVLSESGAELTAELTIAIAKVNQMSAYSLMDPFSSIRKMSEEKQQLMKATLQKIMDGLDPKEHESMYSKVKGVFDSA